MFSGLFGRSVDMGAQMEGINGGAGHCSLEKRGCGGCPMLSLPYGEQLKRKQARLEELLGKFGPVAPFWAWSAPGTTGTRSSPPLPGDRERLWSAASTLR